MLMHYKGYHGNYVLLYLFLSNTISRLPGVWGQNIQTLLYTSCRRARAVSPSVPLSSCCHLSGCRKWLWHHDLLVVGTE